ncbi:MAG: dihydrodipicolinate synthase family protein [Zavarzinella sp.]
MTTKWYGVFPAATTEFNADESINFEATAKHIDQMIQAGVHGMIVLGTVGENCSLTPAEKLDVLRASKDAVAGRVPLLSGVAETTTRQACEFAKAAEKAGLDGLMVLPGMVYKASGEEAIQHFRAVAKASDLPIMIYNNPIAYAVDITPEMFVQMADEPKFVAIKESSENVRRITDIRNACGNRYELFCGVDDLALESVMLGATGWVSGLVNAFPAENRLLWDLAMAGKYAEAVEVYRWYTPLLHLDTLPKLVQYIKMANAATGMGSEVTRAPRYPVTGTEREWVMDIINTAIANRPKVS